MERCFYLDSPLLGKRMEVRAYGTAGLPVLAFPTQDGMADQWKGFGMVDTLRDWIGSQQIQLFTVDTVDIQSWSNKHARKDFRIRKQEAYFQWIVSQVVPLVHEVNPHPRLPLLTGCSMGGAHAAVCLLRRPDLFSGMVALSGSYDCRYFTGGYTDSLWLRNSGADILKQADSTTIGLLRRKSIVLCCGQGEGEDIELDATRILEKDLKDHAIPAWVDYWGTDVNHDWTWWRPQIRYFLPYVLDEINSR
ncbi:MAG: esterase family protein [Bacteroidales bacterium]|nr:esterase family protein [Bacteroidales bacterium]